MIGVNEGFEEMNLFAPIIFIIIAGEQCICFGYCDSLNNEKDYKPGIGFYLVSVAPHSIWVDNIIERCYIKKENMDELGNHSIVFADNGNYNEAKQKLLKKLEDINPVLEENEDTTKLQLLFSKRYGCHIQR